jgi:hypothetical protein
VRHLILEPPRPKGGRRNDEDENLMTGQSARTMNRLRTALSLLLAAGAACRTLVDPPLPGTAQQFAPPPVYSRWWAMTESCSGLTGSLARVTWYTVPGSTFVPLEDIRVVGYWSQRSNRIVIAEMDILNGAAVRHEMLHALKQRPGHPRADFLDKCGNVVVCAAECAAEGRHASASDADINEPRVPATELDPSIYAAMENPGEVRESAAFALVTWLPDWPGGIPPTHVR